MTRCERIRALFFHQKVAQAEHCWTELSRLLEELGNKLDAAALDAEIDIEPEVEQIEELIWRYNDALEAARDAWLRDDLPGELHARLAERPLASALGLPAFTDEQQLERAMRQGFQISARLNGRNATLDWIIVGMEVAEGIGTGAGVLAGGGGLVTAARKGGKLLVVKLAAAIVSFILLRRRAGAAKGEPSGPRITNSPSQGNSPPGRESPNFARLGTATSANYRQTFFDKFPQLKGKVVVHHAVSQKVLNLYPGIVSEAEMHSLENLRGIPKAKNAEVHLSKIAREWNEFYRTHESATKSELLSKATEIDLKYGTHFIPSVGE